MMWAAISHTGRTDLVHVNGTLTVQGYCDVILQPHIVPIMQNNGRIINMTMPDRIQQDLLQLSYRQTTLLSFLGPPNHQI